MKRIIALSLCILTLFLCACQPTPDHDIIVNKAEATIPVVKTPKPEGTPAPDAAGTDDASVGNTEQASATVSPVDLPEGDPKAGRADIPEHIKLEADPQEGVHVKIDADVKFDREGEFPVIEVRQKSTMSDPSLVKKLLELLGRSDAVIYKAWPETKAEVAEKLAALMEYDGSLGSIQSTSQDVMDYHMNLYANAPDEAIKEKVNIDEGFIPGPYYMEFADGGIGQLNYQGSEGSGAFLSDRYYWFVPPYAFKDERDNPIPTPSVEQKVSQEKAIEIADGLISSLGLTGYSKERVFETFVLNRNKLQIEDRLWEIDYQRLIGSSRSVDVWDDESFYEYRSPRSVVGNPWPKMERIYVCVGSSGVVSVIWNTLTEITQVITEDVPFLSFDEIMQRMVDQFGFEYAGCGKTYKIKSIDLVYGLISEKNAPDRGIYIPLWQVTYTESGSDETMRYFFSAIDGSVVEPRIQTNLGGY